MNARNAGAYYVKKRDGVLRSTLTNKPVSEETLRELAEQAGIAIEREVVREVVKERTRRVKVEVPVAPDLTAETIATLPPTLAKIAGACANVASLNEGIEAMMGRWGEFSSPRAALFAGIAMNPASRRFLSDALDESVWLRSVPSAPVQEVVIGGGLHAAIYSATRVAQGFAPPLVLDQGVRPGGVFALSCTPSFYLNSRNRPGPLSIPGDPLGSLNVLPGAPLQPADICSTEYLDNETMAWVIRLTLALSARVVASVGVQSCGAYSYSSRRNLRGHLIETSKGSAFAQRVIYAQGLGTPKRFFTHPRLLDFTQFMARMDERFPLQGVEKVAVVGNGDSARTTIESLLGLGPPLGMSVATLDWPRQVHWYGPGTAMTCDSWLAANRTRYAGIAAGLPRNKTNASPRIVPKDVIDTARILPGYNSILVEEKPFDLVIDCTGWTPSYVPSVPTFENYTVENRLLAKRNGTTRYQIGPASELPLSADENTLISAIVENSTSLFRYAGRTAQLAAMLPA